MPYQNTTKALKSVDLNLQSSQAECCEETFSDYQHDYDPDYSVPHPTEPQRSGDYRSNSTTVRSKLSAHSDGNYSLRAVLYYKINLFQIRQLAA